MRRKNNLTRLDGTNYGGRLRMQSDDAEFVGGEAITMINAWNLKAPWGFNVCAETFHSHTLLRLEQLEVGQNSRNNQGISRHGTSLERERSVRCTVRATERGASVRLSYSTNYFADRPCVHHVWPWCLVADLILLSRSLLSTYHRLIWQHGMYGHRSELDS